MPAPILRSLTRSGLWLLFLRHRGPEPTVDAQVDPADEGRARRGEEFEGIGDLEHRAFAVERRLFVERALARAPFEFERAHRRGDESRRQRYDPRATLAPGYGLAAAVKIHAPFGEG